MRALCRTAAGPAALGLAIAVALPGPARAQPACSALQAGHAVQQVNAVRAQGATCGARGSQAASGALAWNAQLHVAAQRQAHWLADHGALAHTGPNGESLGQRAAAAGYGYSRIAENVARGQRSVPELLAGWAASEGHCVNLHDSRVTEMALACAVGRDGRNYWALLLGRP